MSKRRVAIKPPPVPEPAAAPESVGNETTGTALRALVEEALGAVPYAPPVSVAYTAALRDHIRARAPDASVDVYHRHADLVIDVRAGAARAHLELPLS